MHLSRREALKAGLLAGVTTMLPFRLDAARASAAPAPVRWIDGQTPMMHGGQTFGVAWPRGAVERDTPLTVLDGAGKPVPSQTWITATWPDGSVKWTAHAIPADLSPVALTVTRGRPVPPTQPVAVAENPATITIHVGNLAWEIAKSGDALIRSATQSGKTVLGPVSLVGSSRPEPIHGADTPFTGRIDMVTVEQRGPVRAVVRIDGHHVSGERAWMPFTVRLYAYAGSTGLRIVHSVVFDGSASRDFLSSLGISAAVPMRGELYDRHVRMATDGQMFVEAVRPLTGLRRDPGKAFRDAQIAGRAVPSLDRMANAVRATLERIPAWGDFRL
ncbi:MAG TPA: Tat pathway signal sequence domain protein, partial [Sphingomonas sp.]|nr:Tat pathway signal sequence domain protein [Sphingomonas sp.]